MITDALALLSFVRKNWRWVAFGTVIGLGLVGTIGGYWKGRLDGAALSTAAAKQELIDQLNQRGRIDGITEQMGRAELCGAFGRVWRERQCE